MRWIYLSPHFDDVALSCGGLLWEQAQAGIQAYIWTVCAADPPVGELSPFARQLHARWESDQNAAVVRRLEDQASCQCLGATPHYFAISDCIYRRHPQTRVFMYASEASLTGALQAGDFQIIPALQDEMAQALEPGAVLVCPLGLGNHVDHQLTRLTAEGLGHPLWYYADYPYVLRYADQLESLSEAGWTSQLFPVSQAGLTAWQKSIAAHASQISTFWAGIPEMARAVSDYLQAEGGVRLWRAPGSC